MSNRVRRAVSSCLVVVLTAMAVVGCDLSPRANRDDQPIEEGSTVFQFLQLQQDLDESLNIVFVPDESYGDQSVLGNRQAFLDDLGNVVDTGYWQNQMLVNNVHLTNFFYMSAAGTASAPTSGICPSVTWPSQVDTDAAFADLVLLIHSNELRDCRWGRKATTEPGSYRTIVHESSHALFNLPDEYCCDGGYREVKPVLYDSSTECQTDPANAAWRNCTSFTANNGTTWFRSEDGDPDIMSGTGSVVLEFGRADWVVAENVLDDLGTPTAPTVFAPNTWDRP